MSFRRKLRREQNRDALVFMRTHIQKTVPVPGKPFETRRVWVSTKTGQCDEPPPGIERMRGGK